LVILIKVDKEEDVWQEIYFLSNKYYSNKEEKYINFDDKLKELNKDNTELYINEVKYEYNKYFIPQEIGEYNIKIKFKNNLINCSYMFSGCENIKYINLSNLNT